MVVVPFTQQSGEQTEERESLARQAAAAIQIVAGEGEELMDGDAIEKYNKGISHVENILNLHKLRQEVLVKEKLAAVGRSSKSVDQRNMRKYASTPNLLASVSARVVSVFMKCHQRILSSVTVSSNLLVNTINTNKEDA